MRNAEQSARVSIKMQLMLRLASGTRAGNLRIGGR